LYEAWLAAHPTAQAAVPAATLNAPYAPFTTGMHGTVKGTPYQYALKDVWSTTALGYQYDSIHTTAPPEKTGESQLLASKAATKGADSKLEVVFKAVDFTKLSSVNIEVGIVPTSREGDLSIASVAHKTYLQRRAIYESLPNAVYCGHLGIFSEVGKGVTEDLEIDCSAAAAKFSDFSALKVVVLCVTEGAEQTVAACPAAIPTPSLVPYSLKGSHFKKYAGHSHAH